MAGRDEKERWRALAGALFAVAVWGASFAVTRSAVREIPPLALAFLRFALAAAVLWPAARKESRQVSPEDRRALFALGLTGVTFYFACENIGLVFTSASHAALIVATIPVVSELALARRRRRSPSSRTLAGLLAALAGVALIFGRDTGGSASVLGDLLMAGAVASWVGYTLLAEHLTRRYPGLFLTCRVMMAGALTLLPLALIETFIVPFNPPSRAAWAGVAFLGLFCSALGYLAWNRAIPVLGVTVTNLLINLIPLIGVLIGILTLGEPFTWRIAGGGGLILGGVVWAGRRREKR